MFVCMCVFHKPSKALRHIHNDYINDFFWNKILSLGGGVGVTKQRGRAAKKRRRKRKRRRDNWINLN